MTETPLQRPSSDFSKKCNVKVPGLRRSRKKVFRRLPWGFVPGYSPLCLDANDPDTVECAFRQRLLRDTPPLQRDNLAEFGAFVKAYLKSIPVARPISFDEWLDSTTYGGSRKEELRSVWMDLRGGRPTRKQCQHIATFVKSEFYPTWKHARLINSRSDAFKVFSGPLFKSVEKVVYEIPEFVKHIPVSERPAHILALKQAGRRYFQTDFTAFESHFDPRLMDCCECALYRHCLQYTKEAEFLCSVIKGKNNMKTRTGVSACVTGRRMSGDMCTSLGNGFTNLMLAKFVAAKKNGTLTGFVEGDDGLFSTDVELTAQDYAELGFTIKIDEVPNPCEASFCGMVFAESGQIIKEPQKFLMGFGWTSSDLFAGKQVMLELLRAKAMSSAYECPQCPIIGAISREALRRTRGTKPRFVNDGYHVPHDELPLEPFCPAHDTRVLFEKLYGVTIQAQIEIENAVVAGDMTRVAALLPPTGEQLDYTDKFVCPD